MAIMAAARDMDGDSGIAAVRVPASRTRIAGVGVLRDIGVTGSARRWRRSDGAGLPERNGEVVNANAGCAILMRTGLRVR